MVASLQKALMGNGPCLQKAILLRLCMNALAVASDVGEAEEDWHGRWWRQHLPVLAWIQIGSCRWLPEPVFGNGRDPTMTDDVSGGAVRARQQMAMIMGLLPGLHKAPNREAEEDDEEKRRWRYSGNSSVVLVFGFRSQVRRNLRRFLEWEGIPPARLAVRKRAPGESPSSRGGRSKSATKWGFEDGNMGKAPRLKKAEALQPLQQARCRRERCLPQERWRGLQTRSKAGLRE